VSVYKFNEQFKGVRTQKRVSRAFLNNSKGSGLKNAFHARS
jgi:hypothetical protein